MCTKSPDIPDAPPPPPPPPPPKPIEFGGSSNTSSKTKTASARKTLAIPLAVGGVSAGGAGLNIPT